MKIYDKDEYANATYDEIVSSCALGFIPLNEISEFSNREKYMCIWAEGYRQIFIEQIEQYDNALRAMVMEFGSTGYEGVLDSHGSESIEQAFKVLNCKNGEPSFYVWGVHEGIDE